MTLPDYSGRLARFSHLVIPNNFQEQELANSPQARKRARQSEQHRARNVDQRSAMRTQIKKFLSLVSDGNKEEAQTAYRLAASALDRAALKGAESRNKASRLKSRLNARLKAISA
ncbi:MAG: small subunit ribosomal protein S20 [Parasphingorhabdus sp.]